MNVNIIVSLVYFIIPNAKHIYKRYYTFNGLIVLIYICNSEYPKKAEPPQPQRFIIIIFFLN